VIESAGHQAICNITPQHITAGRDRRAETPAQARNFLDAMRGVFRWALEAQHVKIDPTAGVRNPKRKKGPGFAPWTEIDVAAYEKRWPIGTKERVWLDVLCFVGPRRGDACMIGRQHIRKMPDGDVLQFRTEKGQEEVEVTIPILPVLARTLSVGPTGDLTFICGAGGRPFTKESFGNAFSEAARKAGVKKSAHGVRKIAATRCADNGATVHQLMAIFGWKSPAMAQLYTQEANRRKLAREAAHLLVNDSATSMPSPGPSVWALGRKGE
jgi:integrase